MKLEFNKVRFKNFLAAGQKSIEIDLKSFGKTLITGDNGAGKSQMLDAIFYALFGKPFRDIKVGQLINDTNGKKSEVELWLNVGPKEYYIRRGQKPKILEFSEDGNTVKETAGNFQQKMESMLGINAHSFKQIVVIGTAGYTPFMQSSLPDKRKFIEDLLNVSIYGEMGKVNKEEIKTITSRMSALETEIMSFEREIKSHREHIDRYETLRKQQEERLQDLYDEQVKIARSLKAEIDKIKEEIENSQAFLDEKSVEQLRSVNKDISGAESEIKRLQKQVNFFVDNDTCPTCNQEIGDELKEKVKADTNQEFDTNQSLIKKLDFQRTNLEDAVEFHEETTRKIRDLKSQLRMKSEAVQEAVGRAKKIKKGMDTTDDSERHEKALQELKEQLEFSKEQKYELFEEKYARQIVADMLKDSGIKADIIDEYMPLINKKMNDYIRRLGYDTHIELDSQFKETVKSIGQQSFSYNSFSQGQKARIDIAMMFTWRDIAEAVSGVKINLLVLDEVFDSATDTEGVKNMQTILDSLDQNVIVISHRESHDTEMFDKHIHFTLRGRFSFME